MIRYDLFKLFFIDVIVFLVLGSLVVEEKKMVIFGWKEVENFRQYFQKIFILEVVEIIIYLFYFREGIVNFAVMGVGGYWICRLYICQVVNLGILSQVIDMMRGN